MRVRATRSGYYAHKRIHVGDVFVLEFKDHFSQKWMEPMDGEVINVALKRSSESKQEVSKKSSVNDDVI